MTVTSQLLCCWSLITFDSQIWYSLCDLSRTSNQQPASAGKCDCARCWDYSPFTILLPSLHQSLCWKFTGCEVIKTEHGLMGDKNVTKLLQFGVITRIAQCGLWFLCLRRKKDWKTPMVVNRVTVQTYWRYCGWTGCQWIMDHKAEVPHRAKRSEYLCGFWSISSENVHWQCFSFVFQRVSTFTTTAWFHFAVLLGHKIS